MSAAPKIALVHDYLREYGGAERVLEALHDLYPEAPVYVAFYDPKALGRHWERFKTWELHTTWLAKIPGIKKLFSPLRFLAPKAFADLDLSAFDVVISSSNAYFAKAVKVPNGVQLCYCHTPPRALYGYTTMSNWKKNPLVRIGGELINHYLRVVDFQVAQKVTTFIANSAETAARIEKFYRRTSVVIFPPVAVGSVASATALTPVKERTNFLYVNRLALAKHPEIAVQVCLELGLPLHVVGAGPMLAELKRLTQNWTATHPTKPSQIEFLGAVSDEVLAAEYQSAKALLYPVEDEDFGMVPVEAMLAGTPVIAHNSGGPRETVVQGKTGIVFDDLTVEGLGQAVRQFLATDFDPAKIRTAADKFSVSAFNTAIKKIVSQA